MRLFLYLPAFIRALKRQLMDDYKRDGDNWMGVPIADQEARIADEFHRYFHQRQMIGQPIPWVRIAASAVIAWAREEYL